MQQIVDDELRPATDIESVGQWEHAGENREGSGHLVARRDYVGKLPRQFEYDEIVVFFAELLDP